MKFSIVLPTYNVGKYIERCLLSCMNQAYKYMEIVVVDDCGQDDSIERVKRFAKIDSRIKIVQNLRNLGTYHARRVGVENATGEYVIFLDPDDELKQGALERISRNLDYKRDIIFYNIENSPRKKFYQTNSVLPKFVGEGLGNKNIKKIFFTKGLGLGTAGKVFNRSVLLKAYCNLNVPNNLRLVFAEDLLLFAEVLNASSNISIVDERLYVYHRNIDSVTQANTEEALQFTIAQAELCLSLMLNRAALASCRERRYVYFLMAERLMVDIKKIKMRLSSSVLYNIGAYLIIIGKARSLKYFFRLMLYVLSLTQIKLV